MPNNRRAVDLARFEDDEVVAVLASGLLVIMKRGFDGRSHKRDQERREQEERDRDERERQEREREDRVREDRPVVADDLSE